MHRKFIVGALVFILLLATFLRFYNIDTIPHGLYIDEVSIGYNAYSILTKGVDEHGVASPLFFRAFGEYKMPVEIYLTSLSMAVFGKSEFAVRFPSALFGTLTVLLMYLLVRNVFHIQRTNQDNAESVSLLSAFLLAISPWHIQFSRGGFEANTALFFYLLGGVLFLHFLKVHRYRWFVFSVVSFIVTAYTYNAYKIIVPMTLAVIILYLFRFLKESRKQFGMTLLVGVVLLLPIFLFSEGNSRFLTESAFDGVPFFSWPVIYLQNYLSFFSLPFLFATGDGFGRHTIVGMGPVFRWELPFLLIGLYSLFRLRNVFVAQVVFFLLLIAPVAAALTRPSPHMLRSFLLVIPLTILVSYGLVLMWRKKNKFLKIAMVLIGFVAIYEFGSYFHLYYIHYPMRTAIDWGSQYKDVITAAAAMQKDYGAVVINSKLNISPSYSNFYDSGLVYQVADVTWKKPENFSGKILYITTGNPKDNQYLQTIPRKHIRDIRLPNLNNDIVAQFWEI